MSFTRKKDEVKSLKKLSSAKKAFVKVIEKENYKIMENFYNNESSKKRDMEFH